jgi:uncharacterized protein (DUF1800 family)
MTALTSAEAAHLWRRLGFGSTPEENEELAARDREGAVDYLLNYEQIGNQELENRLRASFDFLRASTADQLNDGNFNETEIRAWWLSRIFLTRRPLEEKMVLFWHNHFATSLDKVPALFMYTQNLDFRQLALGRFDDLLLKVSRGAAMLIWLDGITSTRVQPNENFAREIQEVFSMGTHDVVSGEANYAEGDVQEIARAFTGWRFRRKAGDPSPFAFEEYVDAGDVDGGAKTIYGQTANFSGEDVVSLIAGRRSTARYLIKRLFDFFVYPLDGGSAADRATLDKFADVYLATRHSIKELLRAIFISDEFFSPRARWALVKTPVEYVVGATRLMRTDFDPGALNSRDLDSQRVLLEMGMELFRPPDVFGWNLNLGFINSKTMLGRINAADYLVRGNTSSADPGLFVNLDFFARLRSKKARATVKNLLAALGPIEVEEATINELENFLVTGSNGEPMNWKKARNSFAGIIKLILLMQLVMSLPEFQLK